MALKKTRPAARIPRLPKGSPLAKSVFGQGLEILRDVPAHTIRVWPLLPGEAPVEDVPGA